jgi:hypothetical protein
MQDKNNKGLDPAFIDNAWLQMEQQLDIAMPQKKRRVIWWWVGFAGIAVLFLNIYLFGKNDEPKPLEAEFVSEPAAMVADKANEQAQNNSGLAPSVAVEDQRTVASVEENSLPQERETIRTKEQATIPPLQETPRNNEGDPIEDTAIRIENSTPDPRVISNTENTAIIATDEVLIPENTPSAILETPVSSPSKRTEATNLAIGALPLLISDFRFPTSDFELPIEVAKVKPINPWHYYLEGQGGFSLAKVDYSSVAVGAGVQRDLNHKWRMELGIQYQLNQRIGNNNDNELADEFLGTSGSIYAVERTFAFQNIETTRWNLYLGGLYKFSPRLSFGLALQGSYFTQAFSVFENGSTVVAMPTESDLNEVRVDIYNNGLSVYDLDTVTNSISDPYPLAANRWQWSLNSSLRYRFAQQWEAALQYQQHLTGWPSKEEPFGGLSGIQVGLRFYLR